MSLITAARITDFERFAARWKRLEATGDPTPVFEDLLVRYEDPLRGHHNYDHIAECQGWVEELRDQLENPDAVGAAFDHHDAVYDPARQDNELQSAELMSSTYLAAGVEQAFVSLTYRLIMATESGSERKTNDERFVHDIDYWILASPWERYQKYIAGVRKEYSRIYTDKMINIGRAVFLAQTCDQPFFDTPYFQQRFEAQAKENVARELVMLQQL